MMLNITEKETHKLWHTRCASFYSRQKDRFYPINKEDESLLSIFKEDESSMFFCDQILNAIVLKQYLETKENYRSILLWDDGGCNYVVLSEKKFEEKNYI